MNSFSKCSKCEKTLGEKINDQFFAIGIGGSFEDYLCVSCYEANKDGFRTKEITKFTKDKVNQDGWTDRWNQEQIQWVYHCLDCGEKFATDAKQKGLTSPLTSCQQHEGLVSKERIKSRQSNQIKSNQIKSNQSSVSEQSLENKTNYLPYILGGVGVFGLVGLVIYFLTKKNKDTTVKEGSNELTTK